MKAGGIDRTFLPRTDTSGPGRSRRSGSQRPASMLECAEAMRGSRVIATLTAESADAPPLVCDRLVGCRRLALLWEGLPAQVHLPHHQLVDGGFILRGGDGRAAGSPRRSQMRVDQQVTFDLEHQPLQLGAIGLVHRWKVSGPVRGTLSRTRQRSRRLRYVRVTSRLNLARAASLPSTAPAPPIAHRLAQRACSPESRVVGSRPSASRP